MSTRRGWRGSVKQMPDQRAVAKEGSNGKVRREAAGGDFTRK